MNEAKRYKGIKRTNLPNSEDYDDKMEDLTMCGILKLGLDELHEAACIIYIKYHYNPAVVENFLGDEFFGAKRAAPT